MKFNILELKAYSDAVATSRALNLVFALEVNDNIDDENASNAFTLASLDEV